MKIKLLTLLSIIFILTSCAGNSKTNQEAGDTVVKTDSVKPADTIKKDSIQVKKAKKLTDEEKQDSVINDILKKKKTMK